MPKNTVSSSLSKDRRSGRETARNCELLFSLVFLIALAGILACKGRAQTSDQKVEEEFYTAKDREAAIRAAMIFEPRPVAETNIIVGPAQSKKEFQLHFNDKVTCDFDKPGSQMGGKTPKFACRINKVESADGQVQTLTSEMKEDPVKVKYGSDDNEVYAEVAATRLFWALGFYADSWFPIKVVCQGCPENPESGSGAKEVRTYDPATTVRKFKGHKMYEVGKEDEGWSWKELEDLNGRPSYEKDALRLLAAFVSHSDNKPPQQRLVCDDVKVDQSTHPFTTTCTTSRMLVQDLGATFGGGGWFTGNSSAKVNLGAWSGEKIWKKFGTNAQMGAPGNQECQAQLRKSLTAKDGLSDPIISEEGRRLTAGLLCQLSDQQIGDLFRVARVAEMPEYHNHDGSFKSGVSESSVVQHWVDAFKQKREQIASGRCRWKNQPADMAVIDNPAGLTTVPNYCSAKLY